MPADRLYHRLPAHIRTRDLAQGQPLRALTGVLEAEFDLLEEDVRQLYDNWFIETCEEWAVPYIGDLLGVPPLAADPRGRFSLRAYVANTIDYRRAKGTAAVLEQLARDITGWPTRVVELFFDLTQAQPLNHVRLGNAHTVHLADTDRAAQAGGPFDPWSHTVDIRAMADGEVHHNIPNVAIFLWRLQSYRIGFTGDGVGAYQGAVQPRPVAAADGRFHIDPLGRDRPLFNRPRTEIGIAHRAEEINLPVALRRYPLFEELQARRAGPLGDAGYFGAQPVLEVRLDGAPVPASRLHACNLDTIDTPSGPDWPRPTTPGHVRFDPETGRIALHAEDAGASLEVAHSYGAVDDLGGGPYDRRATVAEWLDAVTVGADNTPAELWQIGVTRRTEAHTDDPALGGPVVGTLAEALERWNATRNGPGARGLITLLDSASYGDDLTTAARRIALAGDATLAIVAAGWPRAAGGLPRLVGRLVPQDRRPHIASDLVVEAAPGEGGGLILDGLLIEGGLTVRPGDLRLLRLDHCTIGARADGLDRMLRVEAEQPALAIHATGSVLPRIVLESASGPLTFEDCVVGEDRAADGGAFVLTPGTVLDAPGSELRLARVTLFGGVRGRTLAADTCLATGVVEIARRQEGCLRYSFVPAGSETPRRFRCQPDLALDRARREKQDATTDGSVATLTPAERDTVLAAIVPRFTSSVCGNPAFAQLHKRAVAEIARGGDGGTEMGVYAGLGQPLRRANLERALQDYLRLGLEAGLIIVT